MYSNLIGSFPLEFEHATRLANLESDSPIALRVRILRGKSQSDLSTYARSTQWPVEDDIVNCFADGLNQC